MYLTGYNDCLTGFHEPLRPPYRRHTGLKKCLARPVHKLMTPSSPQVPTVVRDHKLMTPSSPQVPTVVRDPRAADRSTRQKELAPVSCVHHHVPRATLPAPGPVGADLDRCAFRGYADLGLDACHCPTERGLCPRHLKRRERFRHHAALDSEGEVTPPPLTGPSPRPRPPQSSRAV